MDSLKIKFKLHGLEFELEGNETTVKEEFEKFKSFITVDLLSKVNIVAPLITTITPEQRFNQIGQSEEVTSFNLTDIPTLQEIKLRDLAKSETDWLMIYVYYASEGGTKEFTRENIIQLYKDTDRKTDKRIGGLSQLFKNISKALYVKSTNDINFILLDKGKAKVMEIFKGHSTSKIGRKVSSKAKLTIEPEVIPKKVSEKKKSKSTKSIEFVDLKLTIVEQKSLNDFFNTKKPKTQNEKVIVAMKWFIDNKKTDEVSLEEMNYLLSIAAETPTALAQVLGNMIGANFRWVTKGSVGKYQLSSIAESYLLNKLPKISK